MLFRKDTFLFTYGSYFWGYKHNLIKAKNEADAVNKFLYTHHLEIEYEKDNPDLSKKDFANWTVEKIEVRK